MARKTMTKAAKAKVAKAKAKVKAKALSLKAKTAVDSFKVNVKGVTGCNVTLINGKVMTIAQKAREEERRLKEYINTRSYNQLQERCEDITERLEEVRLLYDKWYIL